MSMHFFTIKTQYLKAVKLEQFLSYSNFFYSSSISKCNKNVLTYIFIPYLILNHILLWRPNSVFSQCGDVNEFKLIFQPHTNNDNKVSVPEPILDWENKSKD